MTIKHKLTYVVLRANSIIVNYNQNLMITSRENKMCVLLLVLNACIQGGQDVSACRNGIIKLKQLQGLRGFPMLCDGKILVIYNVTAHCKCKCRARTPAPPTIYLR